MKLAFCLGVLFLFHVYIRHFRRSYTLFPRSTRQHYYFLILSQNSRRSITPPTNDPADQMASHGMFRMPKHNSSSWNSRLTPSDGHCPQVLPPSSLQGMQLVSGLWGNTMRIWDAATRAASALWISPDSKQGASGLGENLLDIYQSYFYNIWASLEKQPRR